MGVMDVVLAVDQSWVYRAAVLFFAIYPISMAGVWMVMSGIFFSRREGRNARPIARPENFKPFVSVIVSAYGEEENIGRTLESLLDLDYPAFEVIVVNDGSPDATAEVVAPFTDTGIVRLLDKKMNEGKAMAVNDAIPVARGEIVVVIDADIRVSPGLLNALVPHFLYARVGAVTGNPRVSDRDTLLRALQTLEFSSIISVQRRAQRIWGRVLTVSGAVAAFRRSALLDAGLFSPDMATEDIDMTWKLQRKFWDVRYEPSAVVWMQAPPSLLELWKQRRRWALGLGQVLQRHWQVPVNWIYRRLWPVFYEAILSILWAYIFIFLLFFWLGSNLLLGYSPYGSSPVPSFWGMLIATAAIAQLGTGVVLDHRYGDRLARYFPFAVIYPLAYWMLMSAITVVYTIKAVLVKRPEMQTWKIRRTA